MLKAIVGELPRLAGRVTVLGSDVTGWSAAELTRVGVAYVPQQEDVFLPLSVHDNLLLGGYLLDHDWSLQHIFLIFAVPLLLASACVMILGGIVRLKPPAAAGLAAEEGAAA